MMHGKHDAKSDQHFAFPFTWKLRALHFLLLFSTVHEYLSSVPFLVFNVVIMMTLLMMMMICRCTVLQALVYDTISWLRLAVFLLTARGCRQIPLPKNGDK